MLETITNTLNIPKSRKITFTVPDNIPLGQAEVILIIRPSLEEEQKISEDESLFKLSGTLKNSKTFCGDSILLQKQMRQEWNE